jgi:GNAT superfamily N-acetyltransferase
MVDGRGYDGLPKRTVSLEGGPMSRTIATPARPWSLRQAREDDVDGLTALHRRVFGRPISRAHWLWKLGGRQGPTQNVWVAEADGRLVFQYAGIPTRVFHSGTECWAMVSVDTMTDPDYRRRGLLTKVAEVYAHWGEAGVAFVLGLPNEQWGSRIGALGFVPLAQLRWWVRWLDPVALVTGRAAPPRHEGTRARTDPARDAIDVGPIGDPSAFDDLWRRIRDEGVVRDAAWVRWRYLQAVPTGTVLGAWQAGQLLGGIAFRLDSSGRRASGIVGEAVATSFRVLRRLLGECCIQLRGAGASRVALLAQPGTMLEEAALAAGFLPRTSAFTVQAADLGGGLPRAALFQGGDFDVV